MLLLFYIYLKDYIPVGEADFESLTVRGDDAPAGLSETAAAGRHDLVGVDTVQNICFIIQNIKTILLSLEPDEDSQGVIVISDLGVHPAPGAPVLPHEVAEICV